MTDKDTLDGVERKSLRRASSTPDWKKRGIGSYSGNLKRQGTRGVIPIRRKQKSKKGERYIMGVPLFFGATA